MKSYLLLRNNREYGPYSWDELKALPVQPTDLVWIEGERTNWQQSPNIQGAHVYLQRPMQAHPQKKALQTSTGKNVYLCRPLPLHETMASPAAKYQATDTTLPQRLRRHKRLPNSTAPNKEDRAQQTANRRYFFYANITAITLMTGILLLGANLIRKVFTGFEEHALVATRATAHSAPLPSKPGPDPKDALDDNYQNAITTEYVPASDTAQETEVKNTDGKNKKAKKEAARKKVSITTNHFRVGILGGISNLELKISNKSAYKLDKVIVQVDYLRANGQIVQTELVTTTGVQPNETKTIKVPASKRGVKVDYRIKEVRSKSYTTTLHSA